MVVQQAFDLALQHHHAGRLADAEALYRQILAQQPNNAEALHLLGVIAQQVGQYGHALDLIGRAIALRPDFPEAHCNLGVTLKLKGQITDAIAAYRRAIAQEPDFTEAHCNLGLTLLLRGDFAAGWPEHEWRTRGKGVATTFPAGAPQWDGSRLVGKSITLHAEQGMGDTLQFVRYLPLVVERCGQVVVTCHSKLRRLLQSMPGAQWVAARDPLPPSDAHCLLMSLPRLFATTLETIPNSVPYLQADPEAIEGWRQRLDEYAGTTLEKGDGVSECGSIGVGARTGADLDTPTLANPVTRRSAASSAGAPHTSIRVGLAWAGHPKHDDDRKRSLPLSALAPLAAVKGVNFFSLQIGEAGKQAPPVGMNLIDWTADLHDVADTAALITNLDLVITVDTAVAHLAGAMGRPVWTLLPFVPDWRWLLDRDDSPWYPTMRLFRQSVIGDWRSVVSRVVEALAAASRTFEELTR